MAEYTKFVLLSGAEEFLCYLVLVNFKVGIMAIVLYW